jgi:ribosomal protein S27E
VPVGSIQSEPSACPKCGQTVTPPKPPETQVTCPHCGTVLVVASNGTLVVVDDA